MKTPKISIILVLALGLILYWPNVGEAAPLGTAFNYQGYLYDSNQVANGLYDFLFALYDSLSDGNQIGYVVAKPDVNVIDGYFTVTLDFNDPNAFKGQARWLHVAVRPGELEDPAFYTNLSPRQEVTPAPHAIYAKSSGNAVTWQPRTGYVSLSAAAFNPARHWYSFHNAGYELAILDIAMVFYVADVQLPHGATVTRMTCYWNDIHWPFASAELRRNDMAGSSVSMATVFMTDPSYDDTISNATIDNSRYSYYLEWTFNDDVVRPYGVVIEYTFNDPL